MKQDGTTTEWQDYEVTYGPAQELLDWHDATLITVHDVMDVPGKSYYSVQYRYTYDDTK